MNSNSSIQSLLLLGGAVLAQTPVHHFDRPGGRIAWSMHGSTGPLVLVLPGMGDLRGSSDLFCDTLAAKGYRVVNLDLRGHGESDTGFRDVSSRAVAEDALALAAGLDSGPVVLVGNSYTGASTVWAATDHPDRVKAVVLIDPFVREIPPTFLQKLVLAVGLRRPWGPSLWGRYYRSLFVGKRPRDLDQRVDRLVRNLKQRGRFEALKAMTRTSARECEARLGHVGVPALVMMGSEDPDFPDPRAEADLLAARLRGEMRMFDGAGHYPHVEDPAGAATVVHEFLLHRVGTRP